MSRQTRHAIAHFGLRSAQRIGPLAFQFEHLYQLRTRTVVGKQATHGEGALFHSPMSHDMRNEMCTL